MTFSTERHHCAHAYCPRHDLCRHVSDLTLPQSQNYGVFSVNEHGTETKGQRIGRSSLGTTDFEKAKVILNDGFALNQPKTREAPDETTLAQVFARFYEHRPFTLRHWLEFHGDATIKAGCRQDARLKFRYWLSAEKKLSQSSVRNALMIGKSALNWAWKRGDIASVP